MWQQVELLPLGYDQITVEFTVHLNEPSDRLMVGVSVSDTASREWIAIEAFPFHGTLLDLQAARDWMMETLTAVRDRLLPFP